MQDDLPAGAGQGPEAPARAANGKFRIRISQQMKDTLEVMVHEGLPLDVAAQRAGMTVNAARRAFARPHVKALYNQMVAEVRSGAAQQAYLRINNMGHSADSEHVRLEANKWVAGVDGISPLKRVEGKFSHNHTFAGFDYDEPEPIDVTPQDSTSGGQDD